MGPPVSARDGASAAQTALFGGVLSLVAGIVAFAESPVTWLAGGSLPVFMLTVCLQFGAAIESTYAEDEPDGSGERPAWPRYSVLVALYREAAVAAQLVEAMAALDYPPESLEVLFLVESDDVETAVALAAADPPAFMRIVTVPDGLPRTKPRALNHGLSLATGAYLTVFDAEDVPEADQLKRAVRLFEASPSNVACLQARLVIDNAADGWLARMMAIEYLALFDSIKCGLARSGMPVALGGTSNHFRGIM